jgi:Transglycosylase
MPKPKPRKRLRPRGFFHRWKWILILVVVLLLIPAMQVAVVRFINPPWTLPMLIEQGSAMFSKGPKAPLRYRWIALPQIPEMFLKHLWISEDQRFFQHEGFDWKRDGTRNEKSGAERETGSWSFDDHEPVCPVDLPLAGPLLDQERTGIVLHDLDGNAVAQATHPGAVCKRDRDGTRDLRG